MKKAHSSRRRTLGGTKARASALHRALQGSALYLGGECCLPCRRRNSIARRRMRGELRKLRARYDALRGMKYRAEAGRRLEILLKDLFDIFGLRPEAAYSLEYEQVDGFFTFDCTDYIVESKWVRDPVGPRALGAFRESIGRKRAVTSGLFVSINGFTSGALKAHRERSSFLLMNGEEILEVLDAKVDLPHLLRQKRRRASMTGGCGS